MTNKELIEVGGAFLNLKDSNENKKNQLIKNVISSTNKLKNTDDYLFWIMTPEILDLLNIEDLKQIKKVKSTLQKTINKIDHILNC
tara:strand:+ start:126 stop:383 length:258 start_codon:yes stop_codon:yes gene_type:complete